ncbi:MAG TPA: MotA/TolQ/ExbB proton channel family protein [Bdellovibrionota bacterium]|nr:MotA/TolQ/ExbB proton channel family protein [Bdellovibrionota bacterium]
MAALADPINTLLQHGGFATYLIFSAGIFLVVVSLERLLTLYFRLSYNVHGSMEVIRSHILSKRYTDALQICNNQPNAPEIGVVKAGLMAVENGREAMKSALGGAVLEISHRAEARIGYLSLIANVATLLGLLGTITGLIKTFASLATADPAQKAMMLGTGISEAMYATAAGLCVGILAMVVHTICTSKADIIIGNAQDAGLRLVTWIEQSERAHDR